MSAEHPGQPSRSRAELRRLLESIHASAPRAPAGTIPRPDEQQESPPRSRVELRRLLESIHRSAPQHPAGPGIAYTTRPPIPEPLPPRPAPLLAAQRRKEHRRGLIHHGAMVGGIAGAAIVANVAAALYCLPQASSMLLPIVILAAQTGCMLGLSMAWRVIVTQRRDLFVFHRA